MGLAGLRNRRVAVWGIGREGRAAARAALQAGASDVVALVDAPPSPEALAAWAGAGLDAVPALAPVDGAPCADVVVLSPGVSRYRPDVLALEARGVVVTGGTELFLAEHGGRTVAVTGSKGKSTVTRLTAHLLVAAGTPLWRAATSARRCSTCCRCRRPRRPARSSSPRCRATRRRSWRRRRASPS